MSLELVAEPRLSGSRLELHCTEDKKTMPSTLTNSVDSGTLGLWDGQSEVESQPEMPEMETQAGTSIVRTIDVA